MTKKGTSVSLIIFGLLFIALGVFLYIAQAGTPVVIIVAALDAVFGIALIVGGARSLGASSADKWSQDNDFSNDDSEQLEDQPEYKREETGFPEEASAVWFAEDKPDEQPESISQADLAAREGELRAAARSASEKAAQAKKVATDAINEAKQAEAELRAAEDELAQLPPAEQRAAMRHIDYLAQIAADKSEIAVKESQKAKLAIKEAREAAELHSRAMDAAADAMAGDDEFAEFN